MVGIKIYQKNVGGSYDLKYTVVTCSSFEANKSAGAIPSPLPAVQTTIDTSGRLIKEKIDLVRIMGISADVSASFEIDTADIPTLLGLVTNRIDTVQRLVVEDWASDLSEYTFQGIVGNVKIRQQGGEAVLVCDLSFLEGDNVMDGLGM